MHVHDEAVVEIPNYIPKNSKYHHENQLKVMCDIMGETVPWAKDLPLVADGYITPFYKKD
jgi:DNA polymerase